MFRRYLQGQVESDLEEKMVFLGGPRQVGKTTLAKNLKGARAGYLNWDIVEHRADILARRLPRAKVWVFDEIHKFRGWRNYLKGLFDGRQPGQRILATGSARLDWYRFGGDSLQGRYHYLRLHPLSVAELMRTEKNPLEALLEFGGFPEPFFRKDPRAAKRWALEYRSRLLREDLAAVENLSDLGRLELLMASLPERVGAPLSINALAIDLQVAQPTVARWLLAFERIYAIFRLAPFGAPKLRAVKKEQKHYQFDWTLVSNPAARFENLVASHLLKWVHHQYDVEGRDVELRYFRDVDRREVDFVVTENRRPVLAVECKLTQQSPDNGITYFKNKFPEVEAWQISLSGSSDYQSAKGVRVAPAKLFLEGLL